MESNKGRGSLTSRYLAALLAPAVIAGVMQVTWPLLQNDPVSPDLLAVIFCITAGELFAREFRLVWPDGNVHWVQGLGQFHGWKNLQLQLPRLACTSQPWASRRNPFGIHCASIHCAGTPTTRKKTTP